MKMSVKCIKEYLNRPFKLGFVYTVIDADMYEYLIKVDDAELWISKDDIEHFKYSV